MHPLRKILIPKSSGAGDGEGMKMDVGELKRRLGKYIQA